MKRRLLWIRKATTRFQRVINVCVFVSFILASVYTTLGVRDWRISQDQTGGRSVGFFVVVLPSFALEFFLCGTQICYKSFIAKMIPSLSLVDHKVQVCIVTKLIVFHCKVYAKKTLQRNNRTHNRPQITALRGNHYTAGRPPARRVSSQFI